MHHEVHETTTRGLGNRIRQGNRTGVRNSNYSVGDYVLIAVPEKNKRHKLIKKWRGPRRIVCTESNSIYGVENIFNLKRTLVHHSRLNQYADSSLNVTVELEAASDHLDHELYRVKKFTDLGFDPYSAKLEILTGWKENTAENAT